MQYDASANLNLDKFLPSKSGVKLPLYISTSKTVVTPKYDPWIRIYLLMLQSIL